MRSSTLTSIVSLVLVLLAPAPSRADGAYISESIGGTSLQGDLRRFGDGAPRLSVGAGYVRGPWAGEVFFAGLVPDLFYIDCYGDECLAQLQPSPGLHQVGVDVRHAWRVVHSRWSRKLGIDMVLHGGPRWFVGSEGIDGYRGPGLGGGATFDANLRIVSMYIDFGLDVTVLRRVDREPLVGKLPYLAMGVRLGWM